MKQIFSTIFVPVHKDSYIDRNEINILWFVESIFHWNVKLKHIWGL